MKYRPAICHNYPRVAIRTSFSFYDSNIYRGHIQTLLKLLSHAIFRESQFRSIVQLTTRMNNSVTFQSFREKLPEKKNGE